MLKRTSKQRTVRIMEMLKLPENKTKKSETEDDEKFSNETEYISPSVSSERGSAQLDRDKRITKKFISNKDSKTSTPKSNLDRLSSELTEISPVINVEEKVTYFLNSLIQQDTSVMRNKGLQGEVYFQTENTDNYISPLVTPHKTEHEKENYLSSTINTSFELTDLNAKNEYLVQKNKLDKKSPLTDLSTKNNLTPENALTYLSNECLAEEKNVQIDNAAHLILSVENEHLALKNKYTYEKNKLPDGKYFFTDSTPLNLNKEQKNTGLVEFEQLSHSYHLSPDREVFHSKNELGGTFVQSKWLNKEHKSKDMVENEQTTHNHSSVHGVELLDSIHLEATNSYITDKDTLLDLDSEWEMPLSQLQAKHKQRKIDSSTDENNINSMKYPSPTSTHIGSESKLEMVLPKLPKSNEQKQRKYFSLKKGSTKLDFLNNYDDPDYSSGSEYLPSDTSFSSEKSLESIAQLDEHSRMLDSKEITQKVEASSIQKNNSEIKTELNKSSLFNENKDLCPLCYEEVGHFSRHLIRKHSEEEVVKKIMEMPVKSAERRNAIVILRRKGNFVLQTEQQFIKPVRKPKGPFKENFNNVDYSTCVDCYGTVKSNYLWRHRKHCKANTTNNTKNFNHRSQAQTFLVSTGLLGNFINKSRLREVFKSLRADNVGFAVRSDPLICLYGESILGKHKRKQMLTVVSQKMRTMGKLLLALKDSTTLSNFLDVLKPENFNYILAATKIIAGYDTKKLSFKSPSLALQLGTDLKFMCQVAKKAITIKDPLMGCVKNREEKRNNISQLHEMIASHWSNDIGSLANKVLNEKKIDNPKLLPTAEDVALFNNYTSFMASEAYENIIKDADIEKNYNILAKCTLALLLVFNRRRIGEVQFLDFDTYERPTENLNQSEMMSCLTEFEKTLCSQFKRVVVFGKGSKPVPILFTKKTEKYTDLLIEIRRKTNFVPKQNKYIFATSGSTRWISGSAVISKLASLCGAKQPKLLTSTRFRKQIATILQLMSFEKDELYQVAKFMGHTEKTHLEFYRLTESTYQTAKVAKILLLLESGRGAEFKGKALDEITFDNEFLDDEVEDSQETDNTEIIVNEDPQPGASGIQKKDMKGKIMIHSNIKIISGKTTLPQDEITMETNRICSEEHSDNEELRNEIETNSSGIQEVSKDRMKLTIKGRVRWEPHQKSMVLKAFKKHIKNRVPPKKSECLKFLNENPNFSCDWIRIKTLVFNTYRNK